MASSSIITATLPLEPRSTQSSLRFCSKGKPRAYRDSKGQSYRSHIVLLALKHAPKCPLEGPLRADVTFVLRRPKALKQGNREYAGVRPDRDNLLKPLLDSLTRSGWWKDDGQICKGETNKVYGATGETPCIEIVVSKV